ncbi:MAG: hypothetical protein K6E51_08380 [Treponema sp.]|nr:hypothetical protein [Treponema sp.]
MNRFLLPFKRCCLVLCFLFVYGACAFGAEYTKYYWTGSTSGNFDVAANWGDSGYPSTSSHSANVINAESGTTITLQNDVTIGELFIQGTNEVTIDLSGHTLSVGELILGDREWNGNNNGKLVLTGGGTVIITKTFDCTNVADCSLTINDAHCTIIGTYFFNTNSGSLSIGGTGVLVLDGTCGYGYTDSDIFNDSSLTVISDSSTTNTWLGTTDTNWMEVANWSKGTIPGADSTTSVIIPSGTTYSPVVSEPLTGSIPNLYIKEGATLTVSGGVTFTSSGTVLNLGTIDNSGTITASTTTCINPGTITNTGTLTLQTLTNSGSVDVTGGAVAVITITNTGIITSTGSTTFSGDTFTNNGAVKFGGSETFSYGTKTSETNSSIIYTGSSASNVIWDDDYYNLTLVSGTTFEVSHTVVVNGTLTILSGGTLKALSGATVGSSTCIILNQGAIVVNSASVDWSAASVTSNSSSSMKYDCDGASNDIWTSYGNLTLQGSFTFDSECTVQTLTATGLGGKTLTVNDKVTVAGTMTLQGTDISSPLTITHSGADAGSFVLGTSGQSNGRYLVVEADGPVISQDYTAYYSKFSDGTYEKFDEMQHWKFIPNGWPQFIMCMAPVGQRKLLVVVSHEINTGTLTLYSDATTDAATVNALTEIPKSFSITDTSGTASSSILIDTSVPATLAFSNIMASGLVLTLNRDVTFADIASGALFVCVNETSTSYYNIMTGESGDVTYVQDKLGVSMKPQSMHILSDFAINVIKPSYAYDGSFINEGADLYSEGSYAVHDWSAGQQNYGTLHADNDITIVANFDDGFVSGGYKARLFLDKDPDPASVCKIYGEFAGYDCRAWIPLAFKNKDGTIATTANNSSYITVDEANRPAASSVKFDLPVTTDSQYVSWASGDQITFLFEVLDSSGNQIQINRFHDGATAPLYALRLADASDITSLDLWSFRLKGKIKQRGGVSIFNNVIDVNQGENVIVEVEQNARGPLSVIVMTLDGNVITYLHHGQAGTGTHRFSWNGRNNAGNKVARGLYFIRVVGPDIDETRKVMCVKR